MDEGQVAEGGTSSRLRRAGLSRASATYVGIALVVTLLVLAAGVYYYPAPATPEELPAPPVETTEGNISEASENPAEKIPETNPFKRADNPFDSYTNPFE